MVRCVISSLVAATLCCFVPNSVRGQNVDYFRLSAGPFNIAPLWAPFDPAPPPPFFFGPGGANDRVHFNRGQSLLNIYDVVDVSGFNEQLLVENDSVRLVFLDHYSVFSPSTGIVIGNNPGDSATAIFTSESEGSLSSIDTTIGRPDAIGVVFASGNEFSWNNSGVIRIGDQSGLVVSFGATVESGSARIGSSFGAFGTATVSGADTTWDCNFINLGDSGAAELTVEDCAIVFSDNAVVGGVGGGSATVFVDGDDTAWSNSDRIDFGDIGDGALEITNGGFTGTVECVLGFADGSGTVSVSGIGSRLFVSDELEIRDGSLFCEAGGTAALANVSIGHSSSSNGLVVISDEGSRMLVEQDMFVGGSASGAGGTGRLLIQNGAKVQVDGETQIYDEIVLEGGTFCTEVLNIETGGTFEFEDGTLQAGLVNGDVLQQDGRLAPGPGADATIITGDYTMQQQAFLEIEINGLGAGTQYDFVQVLGDVFLDGYLTLDISNNFEPGPDDTFTILSASDGGLLNFFNNVGDNQRLETVGGEGSFLVRYGATSPNADQVVLSEFEPSFIVGDVNGDGEINLLDIGPFVELLTSGGFEPAADINMDGEVNLLDVGFFVQLLMG